MCALCLESWIFVFFNYFFFFLKNAGISQTSEAFFLLFLSPLAFSFNFSSFISLRSLFCESLTEGTGTEIDDIEDEAENKSEKEEPESPFIEEPLNPVATKVTLICSLVRALS